MARVAAKVEKIGKKNPFSRFTAAEKTKKIRTFSVSRVVGSVGRRHLLPNFFSDHNKTTKQQIGKKQKFLSPDQIFLAKTKIFRNAQLCAYFIFRLVTTRAFLLLKLQSNNHFLQF